MDKQIDGQIRRLMNRQKDRQIDRQIDRQTDMTDPDRDQNNPLKRVEEQIGRWIDRQIDGQIDMYMYIQKDRFFFSTHLSEDTPLVYEPLRSPPPRAQWFYNFFIDWKQFKLYRNCRIFFVQNRQQNLFHNIFLSIDFDQHRTQQVNFLFVNFSCPS